MDELLNGTNNRNKLFETVFLILGPTMWDRKKENMLLDWVVTLIGCDPSHCSDWIAFYLIYTNLYLRSMPQCSITPHLVRQAM